MKEQVDLRRQSAVRGYAHHDVHGGDRCRGLEIRWDTEEAGIDRILRAAIYGCVALSFLISLTVTAKSNILHCNTASTYPDCQNVDRMRLAILRCSLPCLVSFSKVITCTQQTKTILTE